MRRRLTRVIALMSMLALVVAACSADDSGVETFSEIGLSLDGEEAATATTSAGAGDSADSRVGVEVDAAAPANDDSEPDGAGGGGVAVPAVYQASPPGRDIIFVSETTVAVADVTEATGEAVRIVSELGGFLFGQSSVGDPHPETQLTFKVPPANFHRALDRLGSVGDVRTQTVSAEDVTERIVNVESQIATSEASVERLRSLLASATDIKQVVALEEELLERETQLEVLRGQLRTLEDRVALATINLRLSEAAINPSLALAVGLYPGVDTGAGCPSDTTLAVTEGDMATMCFEVFNTGDTILNDVVLTDAVLGLNEENLTIVFGSVDLEPGQSVVFAHEFVVERDIRTQTTVEAVPVNLDGSTIEGAEASVTVNEYVDAVDAGGVPTFGDAMATSWQVLTQLGQLTLAVLGALVPFVWIPIGVIVVWRIRRKETPVAHSK